jgi:FkbM family methyltransferase
MQFGPLALKRCKYGWMLFSGPIIGKCFDLYGQYSESELSMMRGYLREGSVAIDVGANIGDLTVPLAQMVGESGRLYAIESHPQNFHILCANLALNGIRNTKAINAFIATSSNADTKSEHWGEFAYVSQTWAPQFLAIDSLEVAACDLIKVDVDGKELDVLRSGEMQIERFRPVLYFENDVRASSQDLLDYVMHKLKYDLYWHPAPIFEPENYFGNPVNHWAPRNIVSLMVVAIPSEQRRTVPGLKRISNASDWWDGLEQPN